MAHGGAPPLDGVALGDGWLVAALASGAWTARPEVVAPLVIVAAAYAVGWWRLSRRGAPVSPGRVAAAAAGLGSLAAALLSPLDRVAHAVFAAHMLQHVLLISVAAPLLLLADPFAAILWALPRSLRIAGTRPLRQGTWLRWLWSALTALPVAWVIHVAVLWLWHLPIAYDAAVDDRFVHDAEHLAFFASAVLFWWPIVQPAPRLRARAAYGPRMVYLVLAASQSALLGLLLALSPRPWYRTYASVTDQSAGGVVMWGLSGALDMLAVLLVLARYLGTQDQPEPAAVRQPRSGAPGGRPDAPDPARAAGRQPRQ